MMFVKGHRFLNDLVKGGRFKWKWLCGVCFALITLNVLYVRWMERERTLATAKKNISLISQSLLCHGLPQLPREVFPECVPSTCGRLVSDIILEPKEFLALIEFSKQLLPPSMKSSLRYELGTGRVLMENGGNVLFTYNLSDFRSFHERKYYKNFEIVVKKVKFAISTHFKLNPDKLYYMLPSYFSRFNGENLSNGLYHEDYWMPQITKENYIFSEYAAVIFLSDYDQEFMDGRFVFLDSKTAGSNQKVIVEPLNGRVLIYTTGAENTFQINKVTDGIRFSFTILFTCNKVLASPIPNPFQKQPKQPMV